MRLSRKLMIAVSAVAICGSVGATAGPVAAATDHCSTTDYPNKVNLDGESASTFTGLAPGTAVCIKAGTQITIVYVDGDGYIENLEITNGNGQARGISYYAYGDSYEPPCDPYCS